MGFVVAIESVLRPRAYFIPYGLTHSLRASYTIWMVKLLPIYIYIHDCVILKSCAGTYTDSRVSAHSRVATQLVLGLHAYGLRGCCRECA